MLHTETRETTTHCIQWFIQIIHLTQEEENNVVTRMQDEAFPLNLTFKYARSSSIRLWSVEPHCAKQDMACITKSSSGMSTVLRYYAVLSG